jgi:hypothetical protein
MSHHFDTPTALEDPRINLCDYYLFRGRPGATAMAMTVNPDSGLSAPDSFREDAIYAFRFDLDGDAQEELTFKLRFGPVEHPNERQRNVQTYKISRATGPAALEGAEGKLILKGRTGEIIDAGKGVKAFAGLAADPFAGDAAALDAFRAAFYNENRLDLNTFQTRVNFFAKRNVTAIILEVPTKLIGRDLVHGWATVSLYGHEPEMQVSRWGLPLITNIFMPDLKMRENFNRSAPADDRKSFGGQIAHVAEGLTMLANSATDPADYARHLVTRLCPTVLPYELGTRASFDCDGFNGRPLTDDATDVILRLATNISLVDGIAPGIARTRDEFPYFGEPYSKIEQVGIAPAKPKAKNK